MVSLKNLSLPGRIEHGVLEPVNSEIKEHGAEPDAKECHHNPIDKQAHSYR